jgi:serine/threonine-protein kinase
MDEQQPTSFGRYKVKGVIGKGAMGVIYLAEDPVIGRQLAIKVIQLNPGISAQEIENLQTRFEREFRSAGTLSHPNIVTVHDVGKEGATPFIAMEYVEGKTLEHVISEQRVLSFEEVADLVGQICDGLDFAHQHGVVHRDVKPANILLDRTGRPKITDFGVAKLTESGMTHTGTMVGTPWYMSPEQVVGETVTGAADQFSVAVMTYQLLTRERPFTGERSSTVLYKIVHEEPVRPHLLNPKLMDALDDVLMRAFAKNPIERYPECNEFARELRAALGVAAARSNKTLSDATPATEWPTASMTLDKGLMKEWQEQAKSGAKSGAGSGARSGQTMPRPAATPAAPPSPPPPQPAVDVTPAGPIPVPAAAAAAAAAAVAAKAATPPPPAPPPQLSKADRKRQAKEAKEAQAREAKAAADAKAAQAKAAQAAAAQAKAAQAAAAAAAAPATAPAAAQAAKAAAPKVAEAKAVGAKPAAAKPKAPSKGLGAGAWIAIATVVLALGAGAIYMMSRGGASDDVAPVESADAALDAIPIEDEPQPLPPELSADIPPPPPPPVAADGEAVATGPQLYRIVTRPVGATITVDGKALEGIVTPAEIELPHDAKHLIQLDLEGHKPIRWTFVADRLSEDQQRTRTLYFPLASAFVAAPAPAPVQQQAAAPAPPPPPVAAAPAVELPSSPAGVLDKSIKTVRGGREVPMPRKIIDAGAIYDKSLVPTGRQPIVILELTIDPAGQVANAKVLNGLTHELDEIARRTSYRWKYEVAPLKGKPVNTVVTGTVVFEGP